MAIDCHNVVEERDQTGQLARGPFLYFEHMKPLILAIEIVRHIL
jgi:hypothetical protein